MKNILIQLFDCIDFIQTITRKIHKNTIWWAGTLKLMNLLSKTTNQILNKID